MFNAGFAGLGRAVDGWGAGKPFAERRLGARHPVRPWARGGGVRCVFRGRGADNRVYKTVATGARDVKSGEYSPGQS